MKTFGHLADRHCFLTWDSGTALVDFESGAVTYMPNLSEDWADSYLAYSREHEMIVLGTYNTGLLAYSTVDGLELWRVPSSEVQSVTILRETEVVLVEREDECMTVSLRSGTRVKKVLPDCHSVCAADPGIVATLTRSSKMVYMSPPQWKTVTLVGFDHAVDSVAVVGEFLCINAFSDTSIPEIYVHSIQTGERVALLSLPAESFPVDVVPSPRGELIAMYETKAGSVAIRIFSMTNMRSVCEFEVPENKGEWVLSRTGMYVLSSQGVVLEISTQRTVRERPWPAFLDVVGKR